MLKRMDTLVKLVSLIILKGFGFIVDPETQEQFFVHISECIDEIKGRKQSFF
jgi:hypothetical protein